MENPNLPFNIYESRNPENKETIDLNRLVLFKVIYLPDVKMLSFLLVGNEPEIILWKYSESSVMIYDIFNITQRRDILEKRNQPKRPVRKMKTPEETMEAIRKDQEKSNSNRDGGNNQPPSNDDKFYDYFLE